MSSNYPVFRKKGPPTFPNFPENIRTYARTLWPTAIKFHVLTHGGAFYYGVNYAPCRGVDINSPNFWTLTYAHSIWPRMTKFGTVTHVVYLWDQPSSSSNGAGLYNSQMFDSLYLNAYTVWPRSTKFGTITNLRKRYTIMLSNMAQQLKAPHLKFLGPRNIRQYDTT